MSWAKWDAEHRAAGVRVTASTPGRSKVTSGGKHLGNIEKRGNKHVAVTKVNGVLQSNEFATHHGALNHIRKTHGLPAVSAKKTAPSVPHLPGMGLATPKTSKKTAAKKVAAPPRPSTSSARPAGGGGVPHHDWSKWDDQHGSGSGVPSADRIAAQIRGSLGHSTPTGREVTSKKGKSGSTISRAADARSTATHVQKKDMKRPAPVKGEKDQADAFRTKIRMAEYNRKKEAAKVADPVNATTPKTEQLVNPHTAPKGAAHQSSAALIASKIQGVHAEQRKTHPAPAPRHAPGSLEDLADQAEAATRHADANPSYTNHQKAYQAHTAALKKASSSHLGDKANVYHQQMQGYHRFAADHPDKLIPASVDQEHKDEHASRFPTGTHQLFTGYVDTQSRRRSQRMYDTVPKASSSTLTSHEINSIGSYTGSAYSIINGHLRGTHTLTAAEKTRVNNHIGNLDSAFNKQPGLEHDLITYRGVRNADSMFGSIGSRVGGEFEDKGYVSSATHAAVASGFGGTGALIRILHPKGSRVLKPSDTGSFGDVERELLTPRGSRFHVAADRMVTMKNGTKRRLIDLVRK